MKNLISLLAFSLIPFSLLAQPKPAARKPTPVRRSITTRTTTAPVRKPVAKPPTARPSGTAPVRQQPPAVAYVAPQPQAAAVSRPIYRTAPTSVQEGRVRVGFRLGLNSSTIGGVDLSPYGPGVKLARVTGFHGGVFFTIGGPQFSVQPEILFSQSGVRLTDGSDYIQIKYSFVEVPVLFKATFGQPNLRFFVNAGPVMTYRMGGTVSAQEGGQSDSKKIDMTNVTRLSFGASGGAGVALQAGPGSVLVEARYSYLFSNENGVKLNPQHLMVSAGYQIPLGR